MIQLGLLADFERQVLQWDDIKVPMKEPIGLLGKSYLTIRDMHKVVMHTEETDSK